MDVKKAKTLLRLFMKETVMPFMQEYFSSDCEIDTFEILNLLVRGEDLYDELRSKVTIKTNIEDFEFFVAAFNMRETFKYELPIIIGVDIDYWIKYVKQDILGEE